MASIRRRRVFYNKKNDGQYRFLGWAHVVTSMGVMAEPFNLNDRHVPSNNMANYDPSDMMARIDDLQQIEDGKEIRVISFDNDPIHGGDLLPRTFIKTGNF